MTNRITVPAPILRHRRLPMPARQHECSACGAVFAWRQSLQSHALTHRADTDLLKPPATRCLGVAGKYCPVRTTHPSGRCAFCGDRQTIRFG